MVANRESLLELYIQEKKTTREIGKLFNVDHVTILSWFKKLGIETRNRSESQLGKKITIESRIKMSIARKGRPSTFKGKKFSSESLRKLRESHIRFYETHPREEYPGYIHGQGYAPYPSEFSDSLKEKIRRRDNFTCQKCGMIEEEHLKKWNQKLHVHHIDYVKENLDEANLTALCNRCNVKVNSERDKWCIHFKFMECLRDDESYYSS